MLFTFNLRFIFSSVYLASLIFSFPIEAAEPQAHTPTKITVVTEYLEPYQIQNADGRLGGQATEVIEALFAKLNIPLEIKVMSWARAYAMATKQSNVLIYSIARTKERENDFHWLGHLAYEQFYFWGLNKNFTQPINHIEQLKSYNISASRGSNVESYLRKNQFKNIYDIVTEDQSLLMLNSARIDLIVETELTLKSRAKKLGLDYKKLKKLKEVKALNNELGFAFSKKTDINLVKLFIKTFKELKQEGVIAEINKRWALKYQ